MPIQSLSTPDPQDACECSGTPRAWGRLLLIAALALGPAVRTGAGAAEQVAGAERAQPATPRAGDEVARGAYVARAGDCAGCHSPPGSPDFSGGLPLHSPLGTIYSTNITPDPDTGIGKYSLQDFEQALRTGKSPRHRLYPAMPYPSFAKMTDEDMRALYAYFMHGVKPVHRVPPRTDLPFPFSQRWALGLWNLAFLDASAYRFDITHDAHWNRGAYLVQGPGHCGACHTPRGIAYEERGHSQASRQFLTGGITDHWLAPNLTGDPVGGLGRWSQADIVSFLQSGHATSRMVFGPMVKVVTDSLQHLDKADIEDIALYLKSLPAHRPGGAFLPAVQARPTQQALASGMAPRAPGSGLYANFCARCHQADGRGSADKAPALADSAVVRAVDPSSVIHIILSGGKPAKGAAAADVEAMPAFSRQFDDREVAEVASFVRRSWGNNAPPVTPREVGHLREAIAAEKQ